MDDEKISNLNCLEGLWGKTEKHISVRYLKYQHLSENLSSRELRDKRERSNTLAIRRKGELVFISLVSLCAALLLLYFCHTLLGKHINPVDTEEDCQALGS